MTGSNGAGEGHGAAVRRVEDPPFLRGARPYTDDLREPEALYAVFVRSGFAHARVGDIDIVRGGRRCPASSASTRPPTSTSRTSRPARRRSRRPRRCAARCSRATPCASSASRSPSWSPRRAGRPSTPPSSSTSTSTRSTRSIDMTKALDDDAPKLFPDSENGNLAAAGPPGEDALADAEVRVSARFINQRLAAVPMEPGAALAAPDPDTGGFILWTPSQGPHADQGARVRLDRASSRSSCASSRPRPAAASARGSRPTPSRSSSSRWRASSAAPCATSRRARRRCSRCSTAARRCRTSRSAAPATARSPG